MILRTLANSTMSETIAITGGTGFVGSALTRRLAATGNRVRALIRPASAHKQPPDLDVSWIVGDLEDIESLRSLVKGADAVVHCAGAVRGATKAQFTRVNVDGLLRLVQLIAARNPAPHFLLISSLAAREPHLSYYAASKREGEMILADESGRLFWTVFRPSAVYGPGDRELQPLFHWMQKGIAPILGSGSGRFSLLYVEDLVEAIVQWLNCKSDPGCTYELHDGQPGGYTWRDVADTFTDLRNGRSVVSIKIPPMLVKLFSTFNLIAARVLGYAPMLTPGKVRELCHCNWVCDNKELYSATGWTPKVLLAEGLQRTLRWHNA